MKSELGNRDVDIGDPVDRAPLQGGVHLRHLDVAVHGAELVEKRFLGTGPADRQPGQVDAAVGGPLGGFRK